MHKSEVAEQAELEGADFQQDEEFAKSLAAAFAEQDSVMEAAASSDFAKSLVLGTIEGLSIAHDEFSKSLSALESRNDEKIAVLAKGLAAIAKAVNEIRSEVVKVSNAPVRPMAKSVRALEKSFGGQDAPVDPVLLKSRVTAALEKRVAEGKLDAFQLVRYETAGVLDPVLAKDIQSELGL
jgi:ActR/RegA family two-component response regulator